MTQSIKKARNLLRQALSSRDHEIFKQEIADLIDEKVEQEAVTYDTEKGHVLAIPLKHENNITVLTMHLEYDTILRFHTHNEKEWVIVYEGTVLSDSVEGGFDTISEGESISFKPGEQHRILTDKDTQAKCIVVTWPGSSDLI